MSDAVKMFIIKKMSLRTKFNYFGAFGFHVEDFRIKISASRVLIAILHFEIRSMFCMFSKFV